MNGWKLWKFSFRFFVWWFEFEPEILLENINGFLHFSLITHLITMSLLVGWGEKISRFFKNKVNFEMLKTKSGNFPRKVFKFPKSFSKHFNLIISIKPKSKWRIFDPKWNLIYIDRAKQKFSTFHRNCRWNTHPFTQSKQVHIWLVNLLAEIMKKIWIPRPSENKKTLGTSIVGLSTLR